MMYKLSPSYPLVFGVYFMGSFCWLFSNQGCNKEFQAGVFRGKCKGTISVGGPRDKTSKISLQRILQNDAFLLNNPTTKGKLGKLAIQQKRARGYNPYNLSFDEPLVAVLVALVVLLNNYGYQFLQRTIFIEKTMFSSQCWMLLQHLCRSQIRFGYVDKTILQQIFQANRQKLVFDSKCF